MANPDAVKAERDRFIAFSFAAADMLVQTNARGLIVFASGATKALTGQTADQLKGASILSFMPNHDRLVLRQYLDTIKKSGRLQPFLLHFVPAAKVSIPIIMGVCRLPNDPHTYFAITSARRILLSENEEEKRSQSSGLISFNAFIEKASLLFEAKTIRITQMRLTLVDVTNDDPLWQEAYKEAGKDFYSHFGSYLRSNSIGGDLATKLTAGKFAFVHMESQGELEIQDYLMTLSQAFLKESGIDPKIQTLQLELGDDAFPTSDTIKTLIFTLRQFEEHGIQGIDYISLSQAVDAMMKERHITLGTNFSDRFPYPFHLVYQPIVHLDGSGIHHFEALSRFQSDKSPFEIVTYAEEVGLTEDFDLSVCQRILSLLHELQKVGRCPSIAMNVSAHSLESTLFVAALRTLLARADVKLRRHVMFEVTESARIHNYDMVNNVLQTLRRDGHQVCLDDMGSGLTTFTYMRALKVDYVKIDGVFIHQLASSERDKAFVKSMSQLCKDLNVETIAEMVETEDQAKALRDIGVPFAQGYHFARPSAVIIDFLGDDAQV